MIVVLLALFASACGGSDAATDSDVAEAVTSGEVEVASSIDTVDNSSSTDAADCANSAASLTAADGDIELAAEVELPPAEKPPVGEEYLVPVDELITTDLIVGTGDEAVAGATVDMQYVGVRASDGGQFDASWDRGGQAFSFMLGSGQVIAGWDEGIEGMKVGGRRVLQIPSAKAYGETERGADIPANSDLVFIVDLIAVGAAPEPAPPVDATYLGTFGDLEIVDLVVGEGCTAQIGDIVRVHYVGVNGDDGEQFDSSWSRSEPFSIVVGRSQVIDGWNAGIEGMKVGGQRILQIPAAQAYGEGDLVFRVHLEERVEAPLAHTLAFSGDVPTEVEITTLIEGSGDGATTTDIIDLNLVVMLWESGTILQSTWEQGQTAQLALSGGSLLPGLAEGIEGVKVGETRQIVIPAGVAYPDGVPEGAGFEDGDAIVFVIAPVDITAG